MICPAAPHGHVMQLAHAFKELAPANDALQWQTLAARKDGSPALGESATHSTMAMLSLHNYAGLCMT